jgi:hypothetical protein
MTALRSVCIYCGSSTGNDPRHAETARKLGALLARRDITLVFGGGRIGLMGILADTVLDAGGKVIGVIPESLSTKEIAHTECSELIVTSSMHARKEKMFELSDGFMALPGGIGTLEEVIEVITWRQLRFHDKPIVVLSDGGYWQPLKTLFEATVAGGFAHADLDRLCQFAATPEEAVTFLSSHPAPARSDAPTPLF